MSKNPFNIIAQVEFNAVANQLKPGGWAVTDYRQNITDLVDSLDNYESLYLIACECLRKLEKKYEKEAKIYSEKAIEKTFDESGTNPASLKAFSTRAENGKAKSAALKRIIKMINKVKSGDREFLKKK